MTKPTEVTTFDAMMRAVDEHIRCMVRTRPSLNDVEIAEALKGWLNYRIKSSWVCALRHESLYPDWVPE